MGGWDGGHLDNPSIVKINIIRIEKMKPLNNSKSQICLFGLFVKKGSFFIESEGQNLRNHILFLKKRSIEYRDFDSKNII